MFEKEKHDYNYDAVFGKIANFNWQFNKDGSYKTDGNFEKLGVNTKCKWCEFAKSPEICDKGKA